MIFSNSTTSEGEFVNHRIYVAKHYWARNGVQCPYGVADPVKIPNLQLSDVVLISNTNFL